MRITGGEPRPQPSLKALMFFEQPWVTSQRPAAAHTPKWELHMMRSEAKRSSGKPWNDNGVAMCEPRTPKVQ